MKINTTSTGQDQFYFKINFLKKCYDFLSLDLLKDFYYIIVCM